MSHCINENGTLTLLISHNNEQPISVSELSYNFSLEGLVEGDWDYHHMITKEQTGNLQDVEDKYLVMHYR